MILVVRERERERERVCVCKRSVETGTAFACSKGVQGNGPPARGKGLQKHRTLI